MRLRPPRSFCLTCAALVLQACLLAWPAQAQTPRNDPDPDRLGLLVPDFAKLQSGGYSGTATLGLGYAAFEDKLNASVLYGYVPPGPGRSVHSLHFLLSLRPGELRLGATRWVPIYPGLGTLWTRGAGYFLVLPKRYPPGHYYPTALRFSAHVGSELDWLPGGRVFERHGVYVELTTIDVFVFEYLKNPRVVDLTDIVSSSVGYRAAF